MNLYKRPRYKSRPFGRLVLRLTKRLISIFKRESLPRLFIVLFVIVIISSSILFLVEPNLSFHDSLWWSIVTLTTVGYGDITPVTLLGRIVASIDMLLGIGVLAVLTAKIASILVERKTQESLGMKAYKNTNHLIICEWNNRAHSILRELKYGTDDYEAQVVLIANIERKPVDDDFLHFVHGEVSEETLNKANLAEAKTVIVLGDDTLEPSSRDAKVVLAALTVESINPKAYTVVELASNQHYEACKRARADEIIIGSEINSNLISNAALNHGISNVLAELLSYKRGNNLYKLPVPTSEIGHTFLDVLTTEKQKHNVIVIGVQHGLEGDVVSNPSMEYRLKIDDFLIMIASSCQYVG